MATALNTACGRGLDFVGELYENKQLTLKLTSKSAPGSWNEATKKRNGAVFKLYTIREEFSGGLTTLYTYEQEKVRVPGYGTFNDMNFTHVLLWIPVLGIS